MSSLISGPKICLSTLLVNEAATNAAKHLFRPARGTLFDVSLSGVANEQLQLLVRDDGPGLAPGAPWASNTDARHDHYAGIRRPAWRLALIA
jgi:anti-sigma regulatory factor (Ser/Thr protein kinase)